jgi:hypothetical protein
LIDFLVYQSKRELCEQKREQWMELEATMPVGAFYGQEATMPDSDPARKVRFGIKTGAFYGQELVKNKVFINGTESTVEQAITDTLPILLSGVCSRFKSVYYFVQDVQKMARRCPLAIFYTGFYLPTLVL